MAKNIDAMPKRAVSEVEKQIIQIRIEKLRLDRERAVLILNKGIAVYFAFIVLAIIGFVNGYITAKWLNIMILVGLLILVVAILPYTKTMQKEEEEIKEMLNSLTKA